MVYTVSRADNANLKEKQNKNILKIFHRKKMKTHSIKLIFLVLVKKKCSLF